MVDCKSSYFLEYKSIIKDRKRYPLSETEYGEWHHILPRCCGGNDDPANLVRLTPEEHYRCHELLPFIFVDGERHKKLLYAWNLMRSTRDGVEIDAKLYGELKRGLSNVVAEARRGKSLSEETKRKLSEANKGQIPWTAGKHHSEETKRKQSESRKKKFEDPEFVKRHAAAMKKRWDNPEFREKMDKGFKRRSEDPEWRSKLGRVFTEEDKKRQSQNALKQWEDPEFRKAMSEKRKQWWERKRQNEIGNESSK